MILEETALAGVLLLKPRSSSDDRGSFARIYDAAVLQAAGLITEFPEHSVASNTIAGTLRGLHFQVGTLPEAKIVRCTAGRLFDVVVDLRPSSITFKRWAAFTLDESPNFSLYVPPGCAHGYQTLDPQTVVSYMISAPYDPAGACGINYADPDLNIAWPLPIASISARDAELPRLAALEFPPGT